MARALELARRGVGQVSPGPLVGCVVVSPGGEIVGEGFYLFEELNHAETIALATYVQDKLHYKRMSRSNRMRITDARLRVLTPCLPRESNASLRRSKI